MADRVVVHVSVTREGDGISTNHKIVEGAQAALQWPGAGMPQVSMGLLVEALRHEIKHQIILRMSNDPMYRAKIQGGVGGIPPEDQADMAHEAADAALNWLLESGRQQASEVALQTLRAVASL